MNNLIPLLGIYFVASIKMLPSYTKIISFYNNINFAKYPVEVLSKLKFEKKEIFQDKTVVKNIYSIKIKNLSFGYNKKNILKNLNYEFKKNNFYGIMAPSGKGKTSLLNLIMGLLEPQKGELLVNKKINLKHCTNSFRKKIGIVTQDVFIMRGTISQNIALGELTNNINYDKIKKCINKSELTKFVRTKLKKINFMLNSDGKNISSGQRQRVGIARALYSEPSVLVLDEPTSSLDEKTSLEFMKTLKKIKKDKIIIMVTHNKKFLSYFDKIIKLGN